MVFHGPKLPKWSQKLNFDVQRSQASHVDKIRIHTKVVVIPSDGETMNDAAIARPKSIPFHFSD